MQRHLRNIIAIILFALSLKPLSGMGLSDSARISLLTCSRGDELYSCFGHSGIRVTDYRQGFDMVFNYGTFDFNQPNFYLNFCRGHMIYMLGVDRFDDFYNQYIYEQRDIYEQELNLSEEDRIAIFNFLVYNAQEQNRNYRYDFLFDNCATRIRDVFDKNLPGRIKFDYSTFTEKKSFRDLINDYSDDHPWEQFGMGILIGLPVDKQATPAQMCFLPDYLSRAFAHASIDGKNLCNPTRKILTAQVPKTEKTLDQIYNPTLIFGILLLLIAGITALEIKKNKHFYGIDFVLLFIGGLLGTLFFTLWFFTEHTTTAWNLNLIWAWPNHLVLAFVILFARKKNWVRTYFLASTILCLIMVISWKLLPQQFLLANIFIAAIYGLRGYSIYRAPK
jgi:hypothetical protein